VPYVPAYRSERETVNPARVRFSGRKYRIALIPLNWANNWQVIPTTARRVYWVKS
jgi:hypothetical protein